MQFYRLLAILLSSSLVVAGVGLDLPAAAGAQTMGTAPRTSVAVAAATPLNAVTNGFLMTVSSASVLPGTAVTFKTTNFANGKARTGSVQLQYLNGSTWTTFKTLTLANGTASYVHKPTKTYNWRFRYPTTGAVTAAKTVKIKATMGASPALTRITNPGDSATLNFTATRDGSIPATETAYLQTWNGTTWVNFRTITLTNGKGSTVVNPTVSTKYRIITSKWDAWALTEVIVRASMTASPALVRITNPGDSATLNFTATRDGSVPATETAYLQTWNGTTWVNFRTITLTNGKGSTVVNPKVSTKYRIITSKWDAWALTEVIVRASMTASPAATTITAGQNATLNFTATRDGSIPATETAYLQTWNGTTWVNFRTITLTNGKGSTVVNPTVSTKYRIITSKWDAWALTEVNISSAVKPTISASPALVRITNPGDSATLNFTATRDGSVPATETAYLQTWNGTTWVNFRTITLTNGKGSTVVNPTVSTKYRIITSKWDAWALTEVIVRASMTASPALVRITNPGDSATLNFTATRDGSIPATETAYLQTWNGTTWVNFRTITLTNGKGSTVVNPKVSTKYRIITSKWDAWALTEVIVRASMTASPAATTITAGQNATLNFTATRDGSIPATETAYLQTWNGTTWVNFRTITLTNGKGSTVVNPTVSTKYRIITSKWDAWALTEVNVNPASSATYYWVQSSGDALNMRSGAGTGNSVVGRLSNGTRVTATSSATKTVSSVVWREIQDQFGLKGWVSTQYLTSSKPALDSFTFRGSGFGHGAGMPQYGAYQMAREGFSAAQILSHYYQGGVVSTRTTPTYISVKITGASTAKTSASIAEGSMRLITSSAQLLDGAQGLSSAYRIDFSATSDSKVRAQVIRKSDGVVTATHTLDTIVLHWSGTQFNAPSGTKAIMKLTGAQGTYRHGRMIISVKSGKLNVVNNLKLNNEYLYGLGEMPSGWGANSGSAALAAQAITGRSYAMAKGTNLASSCDCNVVDTTSDQYFVGWTKENGASSSYWRAAVDSTRTSDTLAQVLTYKDSPVTTHYYSYSGGRTANSEEVWTDGVSVGGIIGYERSVADPYSAKAPGVPGVWQHVVTETQLLGIFGQLSDIKSVKVTSEFESGQAWKITATSSTGKQQTVSRSDSGRGSVAGWRSALRGKNNKILSSSTSSMPGTWILDVVPNQ